MGGYPTSRLAEAAGVSVHVVRDYMVRGLVRSVRRTAGGYCLFDEQALERLRLVRALFEVGVGIDELTGLSRALDAGDATECLVALRVRIAARGKRLVDLDRQLEALARSEKERRHG